MSINNWSVRTFDVDLKIVYRRRSETWIVRNNGYDILKQQTRIKYISRVNGTYTSMAELMPPQAPGAGGSPSICS